MPSYGAMNKYYSFHKGFFIMIFRFQYKRTIRKSQWNKKAYSRFFSRKNFLETKRIKKCMNYKNEFSLTSL